MFNGKPTIREVIENPSLVKLTNVDTPAYMESLPLNWIEWLFGANPIYSEKQKMLMLAQLRSEIN